MKKIITTILIFITSTTLAQQKKGGWSLSGHYGTTIAHTQKIANLKSNNPVGLQFDWFKMLDNQENFNTCNCYPQWGGTISIFDYGNNKVVGQGLHLNLFLEPQFKISDRNYFILRATAGLAFMNRPYDSVDNPNNLAYSLPVSGFVSLAPGWRYYVSKQYSLFVLVPFIHVSNGGIKDPNIGLNFPSIQVGLSKQNFDRNRNLQRAHISLQNKKMQYAWSPFFSSRTVQNGEKKRFAIYGMEFSAIKPIRPLLSINSALEFYKDDALKERRRRETGISKDRYRVGAMTGLQVHLGKFDLYHRLGVYVYDPELYNGRVFHRHGIQYLINKKLSAGVEVKAHKEVANFLDFRIRIEL
jgi:hypothetical protein